MKQLLTIALVALLVSGCRKEQEFSASELVANIKSVLRDSIGVDAAATLDFTRINRVAQSADSVFYLVRSKASPYDFVALWLEGQGGVKRGVRVRLQAQAESREPWAPFNGTITIHTISGSLVLQSEVTNGVILALHPRKATLTSIAARGNAAPVEPDPYEMLSEVVVVSTRNKSGQYGFGAWMSISSMFGSANSGYYAPIGGGAATPIAHGVIHDTDPIRIDDETAVTLPPINVEQYLRCFDQLPDAGASFSIEILTDIPVDTDPNKLVDWRVGSAGHTFLQFRKQVNGQIIVQNIGFYPVNGWKVSFTNAPVPGKFVDNGGHEYNASLVMSLSAENFRRAVNELRYLARSVNYDLDEFNCTDLALRVFNAARSNKLDIPLYQIPGGITSAGTSTPQALYHQIKAIQNSGGAEAAQVSLPGFKGYVPNSNGPCN